MISLDVQQLKQLINKTYEHGFISQTKKGKKFQFTKGEDGLKILLLSGEKTVKYSNCGVE